jgi:hypothetical protein
VFRKLGLRARHISKEQSANILQSLLYELLDLLQPCVKTGSIGSEELFADIFEFALPFPKLPEQCRETMTVGDSTGQVGNLGL